MKNFFIYRLPLIAFVVVFGFAFAFHTYINNPQEIKSKPVFEFIFT